MTYDTIGDANLIIRNVRAVTPDEEVPDAAVVVERGIIREIDARLPVMAGRRRRGPTIEPGGRRLAGRRAFRTGVRWRCATCRPRLDGMRAERPRGAAR